MNLGRTTMVTIFLAIAIGTVLWFRSRGRPDTEVATDQAEGARRPQDPVHPSQLPALLRDTSWQVRLRAANALSGLDALPVARRAGLLAETLDGEVAAPASGAPFMGSYLSLSSVIRLNYLRLFEGFGAPATDAVRTAATPASPAGREWRSLALAATGSRDVTPQLRPLLSSSDPTVRMTAARYLGYRKDRDAIPGLRHALTDTFTATAGNDHVRSPSPRRFYPVRQQAARSLRELGLQVERRGDSYVVH
jgi:HEAT repeat protein